MGIFSNNKKKRFGKVSHIAKLRSPYLQKLPRMERSVKKIKKAGIMMPPPRLKPPSNKGKKILALLLSIGIMAFGIHAIYFADYFIIERYQVEEEKTIVEDNKNMNQIMEKLLGKNLFLLDSANIIKQIKNVHPEIQNIRLKKIFPKTIKVEFEKYPTVANIVNIVGGIQKKYLIDSQGLLTEENAENPDLPYIKIETKEQLKLRTTILPDATRSAEKLTYIIQAINLFEEKFGIRILFVLFKAREREVHLYTEKSFYVMIDMEKDLRMQIEKLKKALSKLDIYKEPLLYIDLRISGTDNEKVIFKRKK